MEDNSKKTLPQTKVISALPTASGEGMMVVHEDVDTGVQTTCVRRMSEYSDEARELAEEIMDRDAPVTEDQLMESDPIEDLEDIGVEVEEDTGEETFAFSDPESKDSEFTEEAGVDELDTFRNMSSGIQVMSYKEFLSRERLVNQRIVQVLQFVREWRQTVRSKLIRKDPVTGDLLYPEDVNKAHAMVGTGLVFDYDKDNGAWDAARKVYGPLSVSMALAALKGKGTPAIHGPGGFVVEEPTLFAESDLDFNSMIQLGYDPSVTDALREGRLDDLNFWRTVWRAEKGRHLGIESEYDGRDDSEDFSIVVTKDSKGQPTGVQILRRRIPVGYRTDAALMESRRSQFRIVIPYVNETLVDPSTGRKTKVSKIQAHFKKRLDVRALLQEKMDKLESARAAVGRYPGESNLQVLSEAEQAFNDVCQAYPSPFSRVKLDVAGQDYWVQGVKPVVWLPDRALNVNFMLGTAPQPTGWERIWDKFDRADQMIAEVKEAMKNPGKVPMEKLKHRLMVLQNWRQEYRLAYRAYVRQATWAGLNGLYKQVKNSLPKYDDVYVWYRQFELHLLSDDVAYAYGMKKGEVVRYVLFSPITEDDLEPQRGAARKLLRAKREWAAEQRKVAAQKKQNPGIKRNY